MQYAAAEAGRPLIEGYKYRFGPLPTLLRKIINGGDLGEVTEVRSGYSFASAERAGRLFDPQTAGGAILDAGCYPTSLAVGIAAWSGLDLAEARITSATVDTGPTGVDENATAEIRIERLAATVDTSIVREGSRATVITGTEGSLRLENVWGTRAATADRALWRTSDGTDRTITAAPTDPFAAEADATVLAIREGRTEAPEMTWHESRTIARLLESWRDDLR